MNHWIKVIKELSHVEDPASAELRPALVWWPHFNCGRLGAAYWAAHLCLDSDAVSAGNQHHADCCASSQSALWPGGWRLRGSLESPAHHGCLPHPFCHLALATASGDVG